MGSSNSGVMNIGIFAAPLIVEGADGNGTLPPEASIVGANLLIAMWDAPPKSPAMVICWKSGCLSPVLRRRRCSTATGSPCQ